MSSVRAELVVPEDIRSAATPERSPAPTTGLSPAPDGVVRFTVTKVTWMREDTTTRAEVSAKADVWAAGSEGTVALIAMDASLDHLRTGDVLMLHVDPRSRA